MKKFKKLIIVFVVVLIIASVFIMLFLFDVGINSKFFIGRDFNSAFQYRISGDCAAFSTYFNRDNDAWKNTCEKEKNHDSIEPIRNFKIQNISHKFGSDRAFLQIELTRFNDVDNKDYSYSVNYEMSKIGFIWKIDQEDKNK